MSRKPRNESESYHIEKVREGNHSWQNINPTPPEQPPNRESISFMELIKRDIFDPIASMLDPMSPEYRESVGSC